MKQLYQVIFMAILCLQATAQKVDLDRFYFNASYQQLPQAPLDTSYRTYTVRVETGLFSKLGWKDDYLPQQVTIDGWRRLAANGHLSIRVRMEDAIVEKTETKERVEVFKDRNGRQTGQRSHFYTEVTYSFAAKATVNDYMGNLILDDQLSNRDNKRVYNTSEYDLKADAEAYFKFNLMTVTAEVNRLSITNCLNSLSAMLSNYYGYRQFMVSDYMWILDSRKHPEYDAHRRAWMVVKQAMFAVNAEQSLDNAREMVQPAIAYYNKIKKRYNSSSKADRKLRYASYYNLAKIYYYLDDPDAAMQEATGLELNDFDARDGRGLQQLATQLKLMLQQCRRSSRHFPLNMDRLDGPPVANTRRQSGH